MALQAVLAVLATAATAATVLQAHVQAAPPAPPAGGSNWTNATLVFENLCASCGSCTATQSLRLEERVGTNCKPFVLSPASMAAPAGELAAAPAIQAFSGLCWCALRLCHASVPSSAARAER